MTAMRLPSGAVAVLVLVGGCASAVDAHVHSTECEVIVDFLENTVPEYSFEGAWSRDADGVVTHADFNGLPDAVVGSTTVLWSRPWLFRDQAAFDAYNAARAAAPPEKADLVGAQIQYFANADYLREEMPVLTPELEAAHLASLTLPHPLECDWPEGVMESDLAEVESIGPPWRWREHVPFVGPEPATFWFTNVGFSQNRSLALIGYEISYALEFRGGGASYVVMQRSEGGWVSADEAWTLIVN